MSVCDSEPVGTRDLRAEAAPPAANDDQPSIGQILQTLQRRPAHTSYLVAAVFSAAWVVGCLALSWAFLSDLSSRHGPRPFDGRDVDRARRRRVAADHLLLRRRPHGVAQPRNCA